MKTKQYSWCVTLTLLLSGCSQLPAGPDRPSFDPSFSGSQALELYDGNGDGKIDLTEAEQSPGLLQAFKRTDQDGDSALTTEEIAERVRYYKSAATTIVDGGVQVFAGRQPLVGAKVTFEPEPFLGEAFTSISGETNTEGRASLKGADAEFPGIYLGMYRVRISKISDGKETIPAQYNAETTLGFEAADDIPNISSGIKFQVQVE